MQGSAPSLNPLAGVNDEGVADDTRGNRTTQERPATRAACASRKTCSVAPLFKSGHYPKSGQIYGEIFICVQDALIHARRFRVLWPSEMARCLVHGLLHLEGFDDTDPASRRVMKRRENKLLKELSTRFELGKLGRSCR